MPWVRIDDHFDEHPKFAKAGPLGVALWLAGLAYCNRNLTDGFIPWAVAVRLLTWQFLDAEADDLGRRKVHKIAVTCGMVGDDVTGQYVADLLVDAGLWEETDDGGYRVHDFDQYQPLKEEVEAEREKKVQAGRAGGQASAQARAQAHGAAPAEAPAQAKSKPVPGPVPVPGTVPGTGPEASSKPPSRAGARKAAAAKVAEFGEDERAVIDGLLVIVPQLNGSPQFWRRLLDRYRDLDLEAEFIKMADWLGRHHKRQCTAAGVLNWLEKAAEHVSGSAAGAVQLIACAGCGATNRPVAQEGDLCSWCQRRLAVSA